MYKILSLLLILAFSLSLVGCADRTDTYSLMQEFASAYGVYPVIYSTSLTEAEEGYIEKGFTEAIYGDGLPELIEYSVFFLSHIDAVGECSLFLTHSPYDAARIYDVLLARLSLLRSPTLGADTSFAEDAFVKKYGSYVVLAVLSDNARAGRLWDKILA